MNTKKRFIIFLLLLSTLLLAASNWGNTQIVAKQVSEPGLFSDAGQSMVSQHPDASNLDYVPDLRLKGILGGIDNVSVLNDKAYTYAYTESGSRLSILDISSPNNLVILGYADIKQGLIVDISPDDDYVYLAVSAITRPGAGGLRIVDVSDPSTPIELGTYRPSLPYYDVQGVAVLGNYAYLVGSSGLHIVNVSNPAMPQEVGVYNTLGSISDIVVSGNYAYLVSDTNTIQIINISNPSNPQYAGQYSTASIKQLAVVGNKAYVATGNAGLKIINVSTPAFPILIGSYGEYAADVAIVGNRAYVVSDISVYVLDITNPAALSKLGYVNVNQASSIAVSGDYAMLSFKGGFLRVIRLADWPYIVSDYGLGGAWAVAVKGNYAYVSSGNEFRVVDVTTLTKPVAMGRLLTNTGLDVVMEVEGNFAYLSGSQGFTIINILNPASPVEVYANPNLRRQDIAVSDHYAYLAGSDGLKVLDVSTPSSPIQIGSYVMSARYISVSGTHAYVTDSNNRLHVVNISNPANPTHVSTYNMAQSPLDIYVSGNYAYIAAGNDGLRIINISNPTMPLEVGSYTSMYTSRVFVSGNYAYLVGMNFLRVLDISNLTMPVNAGFYLTASSVNSVFVVDSYAYLATSSVGLLVLQATPSTTSAVSTGGGNLISELDNISYNFPAGTFTNSVFVSHTPLTSRDVFLNGFLPSTGHIWEVRAVYSHNFSEPAEPVGPFTFTLTYTDEEVGAIDESTLALYYWNGTQWLEETNSLLDMTTNSITATSTHFSQWILVGTAKYQMYLPILARNFSNPDLSIARLEITQAVQNPANTVPLVANRKTIIRVHAKTTGLQPINDVYLSLAAFRNGAQLPGSPIVTGPWAVFPNPAPGRYGETYNVPLPASWLNGQVTLSVSVDSTNSIRETDETNNTATATAMFNEVPPLNITIVPVNYTDTSTGVVCPAIVEDRISDWISRSYPLSAVNVSFHAPVNFTGFLDNAGAQQLLYQITSLKQAESAPNSQVYYGLYPISNSAGEGCQALWAGYAWIGARVSTGFIGSVLDAPYEREGQTAVHEIGHNFGLQHAPCGGPDFPDPNYPYPSASIGQYGYDVFRNRIWSPNAADYTKDVMSYCRPSWFSDYNYRKLYDDQITHGVMQIQSAAQDTLMIRVTFNVDGSPIFHPVYIVPGFIGEASIASPYSIELLDANGQVITTEPVTVFEAEEDSFTTKAIFANIPLPASPVASVRLVHADEEIAKRMLTENSKMIDTTFPLEITQAEDGIVLRWGMDSTPAMVRYTTDEGQTWTAIGIDVLGGELYIDTEMMPSERGHIEVRLADNSTQSLALSSLSFDWSDFIP